MEITGGIDKSDKTWDINRTARGINKWNSIQNKWDSD